MGIQERKEREKQKRRMQIQNAAKRVFLLKGFYSATMEDIAENAELSPSTIYLYFKSKEELFASLTLSPLRYLYKRIEKVYNNKRLSIEQKVIMFKEAMYQTFIRDQLMLRNIFHFQVEDTFLAINNELLSEINNITRKVINMMAEVYDEGLRQGVFVKGKGIAFADIIWGAFTGIVIWEEAKRRIDTQKAFLKPTLDWAFDILLTGIKKQS